MNFWSISLSILYVLSLFGISIFFTRKAVISYEEYNLCGRSLSFVYAGMTYFGTWMGGGTIIGLVGLSYLTGLGNYWLMSIPYFVGFFFAILFITRIRKLKQYSIGDMMALRYPKYHEAIRIPTVVAVVIRNVTVIGMQFSAISLLVVYVFGINRNFAILIIFLSITAYTSMSGLWGIVGTDILQGLLQSVGLLLLLTQSYKLSGGFEQATLYFSQINHTEYLHLLLGNNWWLQIGIYLFSIGLFFLIGDQGDWQKINSCKTDRIAFWGFLLPLCVALLWLLIPAYVGVFQRVILPEGASDIATFQMILSRFSPFYGAFVIVCLLAAVTSSADSYLLATGMILSRDVIKKFLIPDASDAELIFWSRFFVVIAGGMGFAVSICITDLINLWITGLMVATSMLLVPYLCAWFSKRMNTEAALAGMVFGGLTLLCFLLFNLPTRINPVWAGLLANFFSATVVRLFTKPPKEEDVSQTYYWSAVFSKVKNIP